MMPAVDPREAARKKRARFAAIVTALTVVAATTLSDSHFRGWVWALWLVSGAIILVATVVRSHLGSLYRRGVGGRSTRQGRDAGFAGDLTDQAGRDDPGTYHETYHETYQWRTLFLLSRLMPGSGGDRWLAEVESLLSEIAPARRGAAVRSYLRSAPRLMTMMWAHELRRRARLGPRRPG
jgi:hypothetical protein